MFEESELAELTLFEAAQALQNGLVARATGSEMSSGDYSDLRERLMADPRSKSDVPTFVRTNRSPAQFWGYIKQFSTYDERRRHIWDAFAPLLDALERDTPIEAVAGDVLETLDAEHVDELWQKALARRSTDPEGAITAARSLVESVCKLILDELSIDYSDSDDLPKLYRTTAQQLKLAPSDHTEQQFKQILGGCQSIVEGMGSLRNRLSDAHGKGRALYRPVPRHAELCVNAAGTMASFLVATWQERVARSSS